MEQKYFSPHFLYTRKVLLKGQKKHWQTYVWFGIFLLLGGDAYGECYKFRLYPNDTQKLLINKTFGCARYVYNYYLDKMQKEGYT